MEQKSKNILLVITVVFLIVIVFGATYAYFVAQTGVGQSANINVTANTTDSLMFEAGKDLNLNVTQANFGEGAGNVTDSTTAKAILLANNKTNTARYTYNLYLNISKNEFVYTTEAGTPEIILQITKPDGTTLTNLEGLNYVTVGEVSGFDITAKRSLIKISLDKVIEVLESNTEHKTEEEWNIGIVFVNLDSNQQENTGKSFISKVMIQQEEYNIPLAEYILSIYETDDTLYLHDSNLTNGANDNSYRYAGPSDSVNNFVCFGTDAEECPNDNLYRIIGIFDDKVKLIKYDYATKEQLGTDGDYRLDVNPNASYYKGSLSQISRYYWNYSNENNSTNDWSLSRLNKTNLNMNYLNNLGNYWTNKIAMTTWNVGGMTYENGAETNAKTVYEYELGTNKINKTYNAKIGLMYLSEYYYSASPENWTKSGYNNDETKDYRSATVQNWMYLGANEWTISPCSDNTQSVFYVNYVGSVSSFNAFNDRGVRPTFFLNSDVALLRGIGTKSDPMRIKI